jgi:hypothetical protein
MLVYLSQLPCQSTTGDNGLCQYKLHATHTGAKSYQIHNPPISYVGVSLITTHLRKCLHDHDGLHNHRTQVRSSALAMNAS